MRANTAEVVICGAGIAGVAAAYHLAVRRGIRDIVLVDERPPLSLTSDKSTECYRNWWPGPGDAMVTLMNRSIDLLEELARESGNVFRMNRRGYLFATADPARVARFLERAREAARLGAGPVRVHQHPGSDYRPKKSVGRLLGVELPVFCERHAKLAFNDVLGAVPRDAPMLIWADPMRLPWSAEERVELARAATHRRLLQEFPAGVHCRPEGAGESPVVLLIWTYDVQPTEPTFPIEFEAEYAEILFRGMSLVVPAMSPYVPRLPRGVVDGGYYTKTRENRFLACPLPVEGAYVLGALSGYGLMAGNGAADLLADYISGRSLPTYAAAFHLDRYQDPVYREVLERWGDTGQL